MSNAIVLLGTQGHLRQGAAEVRGCVGATSSSQEEGVRATAPEKRDSLLSNEHGYSGSTWGGADAQTHALQRASISTWESFLLTPTQDVAGGVGGERPCWRKDVGKKSIKHRIQLVCQVVKHAADVVQDRDRCFFAENKERKKPLLA